MYACKLCALPAVLVRLLICLDNVSLYVSSYVRACTAANYPYLLPCLCVYLHIVLCPFPMCTCMCMCMCACMCMCMCMCPCPFSVVPFTPPCPIPLVCANMKASPSSPAPPLLPSPPPPTPTSACRACVCLYIALPAVPICLLMCLLGVSSYVCTCTPANYPLPAVFVCLLTCLLLWVLICFLMCVCMYACRLCALPAVRVRLLICRVNVSLCVLICVYMYVRLQTMHIACRSYVCVPHTNMLYRYGFNLH